MHYVGRGVACSHFQGVITISQAFHCCRKYRRRRIGFAVIPIIGHQYQHFRGTYFKSLCIPAASALVIPIILKINVKLLLIGSDSTNGEYDKRFGCLRATVELRKELLLVDNFSATKVDRRIERAEETIYHRKKLKFIHEKVPVQQIIKPTRWRIDHALCCRSNINEFYLDIFCLMIAATVDQSVYGGNWFVYGRERVRSSVK